jgi:ankyrin repeat protein
MEMEIDFPYNYGLDTDLHDALQQGAGLPCVMELVEDEEKEVNGRDYSGKTPLMFAAAAPNSLPILSYLLERGAEINARDKEELTPLYYACRNGQAAQVREGRGGGREGGERGVDCQTEVSASNHLPPLPRSLL